MYAYVVKTCEILPDVSDDTLAKYDAYWCSHDDDVPEALILNVQPTPPYDDLDNLPF